MTQSVYSGLALKRAAWNFITGRILSAALTFAILLWLVRLLPLPEYGAYVVLIASAEIGYAVAGLGLPWLTARFVPEYRLNGNGASLAKLCVRLIYWQAAALLCLAALIAAILDVYLEWSGLTVHRTAAWLALGLLITEGLARFECEGLLSPLMRQGEIRACTVMRQLTFLVAIAVIYLTEHVSLLAVVAAECGAALLGLTTAHFLLQRHLAVLQHQAGNSEWREPATGALWNVAIRMYVAHLVTLASSPQVFLNIVQRTLGAEASALFGFLRTLYVQFVRYLPATLFFTLIRPKLMSSYVSGGMQDLASQANLAGKLSLFALMPLILCVVLGGDAFVALLSGNKFASGGMLLLGILLVLVPFSQRQLIETVAVASNRVGLCTLGSGITLLSLPLMLFLLQIDFGLWAPILAMLAGQLAFNAVVIFGLAETGYQPDWIGAIKLAASALPAGLVASWIIAGESADDLWWLALACAVAVSFYLITAWWLKPFAERERESINAMAGRRAFIW